MDTPRQSISGLRSEPTSSRTSLDTSSNRPTPAATTRRNRVALRDYYGLRGGVEGNSRSSSVDAGGRSGSVGPRQASGGGGKSRLPDAATVTERDEEEGGEGTAAANGEDDAYDADGEWRVRGRPSRDGSRSRTGSRVGRMRALDSASFNADAHIKQVLESEDLSALLIIENELLSEIKTLDGERKALVYDNYSKLIAATDTIKKMRTHMDPLTPATATLDPTVSHIAKTATDLAGPAIDPAIRRVQWILDSPDRLERLLEDGKEDDAVSQWNLVQKTLDKWGSPPGSDEVIKKCKIVIKKYSSIVVAEEDEEEENGIDSGIASDGEVEDNVS